MYQKRTKRQEQKENTRGAIYRSARQLFDEKGFDNVTMEEIAAKAGVSVGSIYFHFNSKQEIMANYHADLDHAYLEYLEASKAEDAQKSVQQKLTDFIVFACITSANLGVENIRVVYPYMMCNAEFGSRMLNDQRPYYKMLQSYVLGGQQSGEIRRDYSSEDIINDITVLARGCIMDWCIHGGHTDIAQLAARTMDIYLHGLVTRDGTHTQKPEPEVSSLL